MAVSMAACTLYLLVSAGYGTNILAACVCPTGKKPKQKGTVLVIIQLYFYYEKNLFSLHVLLCNTVEIKTFNSHAHYMWHLLLQHGISVPQCGISMEFIFFHNKIRIQASLLQKKKKKVYLYSSTVLYSTVTFLVSYEFWALLWKRTFLWEEE